ncbi:hypothetical protein FNF27_01125 [Cafeteria roenbergensis]|uniref:Nudix hydrolase domain-containing protein n=1 Tax=Cafeteria roenbergensis TaxID=33653 RepID=A0A5A8EKZ4_CAFRO|nr:hypothetical protein FNF27_01125 [Cafeteria roenbergensis]
MKPVRLSSGLVRAVAEELKGLRRRPWKVEGKPKRAAVFVPLCRVRTPESQEAGLEDGEAAILLTVRSHNVSTHKGQVSFPGGHIDAGETPEAAAVRELLEEMWEPSNADCDQQAVEVRRATDPELVAGAPSVFDGPWRGDPASEYPLEFVAALGRLCTLPAATGTMVEPVVGVLAKPMEANVSAQFQVSPREVDEAFALTIRQLLDPELAFKEVLEYDTRRVRGIPASDDEAPAVMSKMAVPVFLGGPARVWGVTAMIIDQVLDKVIVPALAADGQPRTRHELKVRHDDS